MIITFPWHATCKTEIDHPYIGLIGLVQLRSIALLPTFLRFGISTERQLRRTQGVVGYRTAANPFNLTFYHLSAWIDGESINRFVHTQPHLDAVRQLTGRLGITTFRYWDIRGSDLPLRLGRELHRVTMAF